MAEEKDTNISIPSSLYRQIQKRIEGTGFESVSAYVVYVLREVLSEDERDGLTQEEEERVKERLRTLGYID